MNRIFTFSFGVLVGVVAAVIVARALEDAERTDPEALAGDIDDRLGELEALDHGPALSMN